MFKGYMIVITAIVCAVFAIWGSYSFDTLWVRYYVANLKSNPIKTYFFTLCLSLTICIFWVVITKGFINTIRKQANAIEPALANFKDHNVQINSIKLSMTSSYVAIYERLKPTDNKLSVEEHILKFMKDSRFLYNNYPSAFNTVEGFSKNCDMSKVTQITALRINKFKHTFLFVGHNLNDADQKLSFLQFEDLPDNKTLHQILDPVFEDKTLNMLRDEFGKRLLRGSSTPNGTQDGYMHGSQNMGEWVLIGIPDPFNNNNYLSQLLSASIWLDVADLN